MVIATRARLKQIKKGQEKKIIKSSMEKLPYKDVFFDYVLSNGVYHNASDLNSLVASIAETSRILKTGGRLVLSMFSAKIIDPRLKTDNIKKSTYITPDKLPMVLISKKQLIEIFRAHGLILMGKCSERTTTISTGIRSILRGVFVKN